jgi:hypothetical protein
VEQIRDDVGETPSERESEFYNKIPGFSMTAGGTKHELGSEEECEGTCTPDVKCKSYSWRQSDKICITSTEHLTYDDSFTLYVKAQNSNTPNKYRKFEGLVEFPSGWAAIKGVKDTACQAKCTASDACLAFSYSIEDDDLENSKCFLTRKSISYSPGFDYYEKKNIEIERASSKEPHPIAAAVANDDPAVKALEAAEKEKIKKAEQALRDASMSVEEWKKEVQDTKKQTAKDIADSKEEAKDTVAKGEAAAQKSVDEANKAMVAAQEEEAKRKGQELRLEFAAAEMKEKKEEEEKANATREAHSKKNEQAKKELNEKKSSQVLEEGSEEAQLAEKQQELHEAEKQLLNSKQQLAREKASFHSEEKKEKDKVEEAKENAEKSEKQAQEKSQKQKEADAAALQKQEQEDAKKIDEIRAKAAANEAKVQEDAEKECNERMAEDGVKNAKSNEMLASQSQASVKAALKKQAEDEKRVEEAKERAEEAQASALKAEADKERNVALAEVKKTALAAANNQSLAEAQIAAQAAAQEKESQNAKDIESMKEENTKKETTEKIAARKAEEAAKEQAAEKQNKAKLAADEHAAKYQAKSKEQSEKGATELAKKKEAQTQASEQAYEKLDEEEKEQATKLKAQEAKNKEAAKEIRATAKKSAVSTQHSAEQAADLTQRKSIETASKAAGKQVVLAKKAALIRSAFIKATVSAFVDSGVKTKGLNPKELQTEVNNAKNALDTAKSNAKAASTEYVKAENALKASQEKQGKAKAKLDAHSQHLENTATGGANRRLLQDAAAEQTQEAVENARTAALAQERSGKVAKRTDLSTKSRLALEDVHEKELARNAAQAEKKKKDALAQEAEKEHQLALAQQQEAAASGMPANTAYGELPRMLSHRGELRVQNAADHVQNSFIKFPADAIDQGAEIEAAHLRLYKYAGAQSDIQVRVSKCTWERKSLTYSNSLDLTHNVDIAEGHAVFPSTENVWVDVALNGAAIQKARVSSDTICLEVSGGPEMEPVIVSSEMSTKAPILGIQMVKADAEMSQVELLDEADEY